MTKSANGIAITKEIGKLTKHKKGFGFVTPLDVLAELKDPKDNIGKDIFISRDHLAGAMNGDIVEVTMKPARYMGARPEAYITRIVEHAIKEVVGVFHESPRFGFVVPASRDINDDIFILKENFGGAHDGDHVLAKILTYPAPGVSAEGCITEIVAASGEPGGDIKAIARAKGTRMTYPEVALAQAQQIQRENSKSVLGQFGEGERRDLRDRHIFTIDGADSKDFDDAVSIEVLPNGNYLLGVHIADVSQYVTEGSPLDEEALARGTSIYLINQVIPMLPEELSNDICSLNPGVDRLTLSVDMEIEPNGDIIDHEIYESVICSCERMVYDDVSDIIEHTGERFEELKERYANIYDEILLMAKLAEALSKKREARGSLDFNVGEAVIKLDESGFAVEVEPANRRVSNRMIEEFMLAANETVAEHFYWLDAPFVYRIHEQPAADKMQEFRQFLRSFGIPLKGNSDKIHPLTLAGILKRVEGTPAEAVVGTVMLRSMQKAFYGTDCEGHYGLSLKYYCHFTSPIRRYPDLMIHRIIKEYLHQQPDSARISALKKIVQEASEQSSAAERRALELEREVDKLKKCEYMSQFVGEVFDGVISGVSAFGMFVEFPNTVEGMIRLEDLTDDYYECESEKYRIVGQRTHRIFTLGQPVTVYVENVNVENREIDLQLAAGGEEEESNAKQARKSAGKSAGKRKTERKPDRTSDRKSERKSEKKPEKKSERKSTTPEVGFAHRYKGQATTPREYGESLARQKKQTSRKGGAKKSKKHR